MNREVVHFLTPDQQASLRGVRGEALDFMIDMIKRENPEAFHNEKTLCERVFFNQPLNANMVYKRFVVPAPKETPYSLLTPTVAPVSTQKKKR